MPSFNFFSENFQDFCRNNNLTEREGLQVVLNRINELSKIKEKLEEVK